MYYSIPGNRDQELPGNDVDLSELDLSATSGSRSFTAGAPKKDPQVGLPRRHSDLDSDPFALERQGSGMANSEFDLTSPPIEDLDSDSFALERQGSGTANFEFALSPRPIEENKMNGSRSNHSRCKSSNEIIQNTPGPACHRRMATCSDIDETKLVKRKSVISYESIDAGLESVIEEQAATMQPNAPRRTYGDSNDVEGLRRGSLLEDILFNSIAQLGDFADSDTEPYPGSD